MTLSNAHAAFLSDFYRGIGAALRPSDACLLEYYGQCAEAWQCLPGSVLTTSDSWAYIPLGAVPAPTSGGHVKVQLRLADGSAGKTIAVKDFGGTVTKIMPAVLSSHLKERARNFSEGSLAKHVRGRGQDEGPLIRVVAQHTGDSSVVLKTAAVDNIEFETVLKSPEELASHIDRDLLTLVSLRDEPPQNAQQAEIVGQLDVDAWVIRSRLALRRGSARARIAASLSLFSTTCSWPRSLVASAAAPSVCSAGPWFRTTQARRAPE